MEKAPEDHSSDRGLLEPLEKTELEIRYIPILCAAPLVLAESQGLFRRYGLQVRLRTSPGWSGVKEAMVYGHAEAAQMLSPMPLAVAAGIDGRPRDLKLCLIQNVNGQALTLASRHRGLQRVEEMRGFRFGVPYEYSMHNYLLRHLLAAHGIDPDRDVSIEEVAPPRMPNYLEQGRLDGVFAPEPFNQIAVDRGVGFVFVLSRDIWDGHPCCGLVVQPALIRDCPRTFRALVRSVIEAQALLQRAEPAARERHARELASALGVADPRLVARALAGMFPDGRGGERQVRHHFGFAPDPWPQYGSWILAQMQRWGQLPGALDYDEVVAQVFEDTPARSIADGLGLGRPAPAPFEGAPLGRGQAAFAWMRELPFSKYRPERPAPRRLPLEPATREAIERLLSALAEVAAGEATFKLDGQDQDELGWLARMVGEVVRNLRFAREAASEQVKLEERARVQEKLIAAQRSVLTQLSTPILPLYEGILVLPLIGAVDQERAERIVASLLGAIGQHRAQVVVLDITALDDVDPELVSHLQMLCRASGLLGAKCLLVGTSPRNAAKLVALDADLGDLGRFRDLQGGLEHALSRLGLRISRTEPRRG